MSTDSYRLSRAVRGPVLLLAVAASVAPAGASCPFERRFTSAPDPYDASTSFVTPSVSDGVSPNARGLFWSLGHGDPTPGVGSDSGTWPAVETTGGAPSGWLYMVEGYVGAWLEGGWNEDPRIDGCAVVSSDSCMAVLLTDRASGDPWPWFLFLTDRSPGFEDFEFAVPDVPVQPLALMPSAQVVASRRVDDGWELDFTSPSVPSAGLILDPGCSGGVVGYRLYYWEHTVEDPYVPALREDYVPLTATIPIGQPVTAFIPDGFCFRAVVAVALVFSDGFETPHVRTVAEVSESFLWVDWDCDGWPSYVPDPDFPLDCDDQDPSVHQYAPQVCDGLNNDCFHPSWPGLGGTNEADDDLDAWTECAGDCDDAAADAFPGADETCNARDDDCDGLTDESALAEDGDADRVHDLCDNCPASFNEAQTDRDADSRGDVCDLDDGFIHLAFTAAPHLAWQHELGDDAWNVYRGDLLALCMTGVYTQAPGSNPLADRACGLASPELNDAETPPADAVAFYLATGVADGIEGGLGPDGNGLERPNHHPCP